MVRFAFIGELAGFRPLGPTMKTLQTIALLSGALGGTAVAADIEVRRAWCIETPPRATVGSCYVTVKNLGSASDRLSSAKLDLSDRIDIHEMTVTDGIMRMRPLPDGVDVPAGATVDFRASGYHFMAHELKGRLRAGERISGALLFTHAGPVPVEFRIQSLRESMSPSSRENEPEPR